MCVVVVNVSNVSNESVFKTIPFYLQTLNVCFIFDMLIFLKTFDS